MSLDVYLGDLTWVEDLDRRFPKFAAGLESVFDVIHTDGALSAPQKALVVAAIGSVKRDRELTRTYLRRAVDGGMTVEQARGAGINILISRGVAPHTIFADAMAPVATEGTPSGEAFSPPPDEADILAYYEGLYGEVPPNIRLAAEHSRGVLDAYYLMRTAALEESPLEPWLADVLLAGVNAAEYQQAFVTIHARFALRGGASASQLVEAVACAIPFAGIAAWLPGANGVIDALNGEQA